MSIIMANTYTQIYMHIVFAVSCRKSLISEEWCDELYKYIVAACKNRKHHVISICGVRDHIHILVSMHPSESVSSLVQSLKIQSSKWVNDKYLHGDFGWQSGYSAFSYSRSLINQVSNYIMNQKNHHKHSTFREELLRFYKSANMDYDEKFIMVGFDE